MPDATVTTLAPRSAIWDALRTPETMMLWMSGITALRTEDGGPLVDGSVLYFETRGQKRSSTVTRFVPGQTLALTSTQGPVSATYTYEISGEGPAMLTLEIACSVKGLMRPFAPLIRRILVRTDGPQLERLKALVEERHP